MSALTYDGAVRLLAQWHRQGDQPPRKIVSFPDPEKKTVRLVEVTELVPATGELWPVTFGPTAEMPYVTVGTQVTPEEWERIRAGDIALPEGWDLDTCEEV
jgi:hypothetical protein